MLASWPGSLSSLLLLSGISLVLTFLLASGISHLRPPSLLSVLPPSQKKVLSFFRPCSLQDFLLQDDVTAFPLLWREPFWSRQNHHGIPGKVTWSCLVWNQPHKETALHEALLNWKERFYSSRHLSHITRGKLKGSHLNSRSITLYIFCFTVTLEQWAIPRKRLSWPFQEKCLATD